MDEKWLEGGMGSGRAENGEYARDTCSLMDMEGVGMVNVFRKGKKSYRKKEKVEDIGNHQYDDGGEACSGTEEGLNLGALKGKVNNEVSTAKSKRFSPQGQRKRSKKLFFGGTFVSSNCFIIARFLTFFSFSNSLLGDFFFFFCWGGGGGWVLIFFIAIHMTTICPLK
jgi:hypothetical protein